MSEERFNSRAHRKVFEHDWFERARLGRELGRMLVERGVIHSTMAAHFAHELQFVAADIVVEAKRGSGKRGDS